jgi:hypothetical protein
MSARLRSRLTPATAPVLALIAGFAASRVAYYAAGVRFDVSPLKDFWQIIDPELLREDLLSSLWHLHTQPPLFNAYVGVVLKGGGSSHEAVFHATYLLAGLALALALYWLMIRLGVPRWWSAGAAFAFASSPAAVLFENWLYVEYLVAVMLVCGAVFLHRFASDGRTRDAVIAFALFGGVVLSRPLFHLLWLVAVVALVAALQPARRRQVFAAAAIPLLLCAFVYGKNLVEWGTPSATTCLGNNLYRTATVQLDEGTLKELVARGELSRYALLEPLTLIATAPELIPREKLTGVPLLDRVRKSTGAENLDAKAFATVCGRYSEDAVEVARNHPRAFAHGVAGGGLIYLRPSSDYYLVQRTNGRKIHDFERAYSAVVFGQFERSPIVGNGPLRTNLSGVGWFIVLAYALAAVAGVAILRQARRAGGLASPQGLVVAFFLLNLVWVTLAGNLLEAGENNRFRFLVDPFVVAVLMSMWFRRWALKGAPAAPGPGCSPRS